MDKLKKRLAPFAENIAESTTACLITMVQGNVLLLGLSHWIVASQTGIVAGVIATVAVFLARTDKRWVIAVVLGAITAVVDFFIHEGSFGPAFLEALVTGTGAGVLSYVIGMLVHWWQARRRLKSSAASSAP